MLQTSSLSMSISVLVSLSLLPCVAAAKNYDFDGSISEEVLRNYLSRAATTSGLLQREDRAEEDIRCITHMGVKFAGRAIGMWGNEQRMIYGEFLPNARKIAEDIHAADPEIVLQGAIFEIITTKVNQVPIPSRTFEAFGLSVEDRCFSYEQMLHDEGLYHDHWQKGASVPDTTKMETKMWFFHVASAYIDLGVEALHLGQIGLMGASDQEYTSWWEMLGKIREYARRNARRHMVLCDAHVIDNGPLREGRLLFDFHSKPCRIKEIPERPREAELAMNYLDNLFGRSRGGIAPSGWTCAHLPHLAEIDHYGVKEPGKSGFSYFVWGWDEMSWFAHQSEEDRNSWLRYAWDWVRKHDPNGYLQMPAMRVLIDPVGERRWYFANTPSEAFPEGFGQEETIKAIWASEETSPL